MFRMLGAVFVFAACAGLGFGKGAQYRQRVRELLLLKKLLFMLRGEIRYGATPLPDAFERIGEKTEHMFGTFFAAIACELKKQSGRSLPYIWQQEMEAQLKMCAFSREDRKQLKRFGQDLGYLDREMQISTIDFYVEQLEGTISVLEQEQAKRSRVYHCLGIFAGIMINLVLL